MQKYFLIHSFLLINILFGQFLNTDLYKHTEMYPLYFEAIEKAADGNFEDTKPVFQKMADLFPKNQDAVLLFKICNDAISKTISLDAAEHLFNAVNASANFDSTDDVLEFFEDAISEESEYYPFYLIRGNFFNFRKLYDHAIADYSTGIKINPQLPVTYFNLGNIHYRLENIREALNAYNTCISLNPEYSDAYVRRGKIFYEKNEYDKALNDFSKARNIESNSTRSLKNSEILNNIAINYISHKNYDKALIAANEALAADDRWYEPFLNRSTIYKVQKEFDLALNDINSAIDLKPNIGKLYYHRGLIYREKGDLYPAKNSLKKSTQFKDTDKHVHYILADVYLKLKLYDDAIHHFKESISYEPDNIWSYFQLGTLYDEKRAFRNAVVYYDKFIKMAPNKYFDHKINIKNRVDKIKKYLKQKK